MLTGTWGTNESCVLGPITLNIFEHTCLYSRDPLKFHKKTLIRAHYWKQLSTTLHSTMTSLHPMDGDARLFQGRNVVLPAFNSLRDEFILLNICISFYINFLQWYGVVRWHPSSWKTRSRLPNIHCQHHGCWWPGDARSQVISSHGIDLVLNNRGVKFYTHDSRHFIMRKHGQVAVDKN